MRARISAHAAAGLTDGAELLARVDWATEHERTVICHGDLRPGNLHASGGRVWLLDLDRACASPAARDLAALCARPGRHRLNHEAFAEFAAAYASTRTLTDAKPGRRAPAGA